MIVQIDVFEGIGVGRSWRGPLDSAPAEVLSPGNEPNVEAIRDFARLLMADQRHADITGADGTVSITRVG